MGKTMRRLMAVIFAGTLFASILSGCGKKEEPAAPAPEAAASEATETEEYDYLEDQYDEEEFDYEDYNDEEYEEEENESENENEGDVKAPAKNPNQTWTIMVYMCGTDLESKGEAGTYNFYEMFSANLGAGKNKINVLVQTGGTKKWAMNDYYVGELPSFKGISNKKLGRYRVEPGDVICEEELPLKSMGDPDTLKDYITWGKEKYPADKYMLILWDHGMGSLGGVCADELFKKDALTLPEIKKAITEADIPFEVIGFDACLMATLETAETLQGYGHYMIASEEVEPGGGWDYTSFLEFLGEDTGIGGAELGTLIADSYMAKCAESQEDAMATLSVTDLTRIPSLSTVYRNFSGEMVLSTQESENLRSVQQGVVRAENYGPNSEADGFTNMVDLGDLVHQTEDVLNQNSSNVLDALKNAVVYEVHGDNRANAHGLSVYYPLLMDPDDFKEYKSFSNNIAFQEYLSILSGDFDTHEWEQEWEAAWKEAYSSDNKEEEGKYDSYFNNGQSIAADYGEEMTEDYYETISSVSPVEKDKYDLKFSLKPDKDGYNVLKITSGLDMVQDVSFQLYYDDEASGKYVYLGSDNDLEADYDKGVFKEHFEGTWICIGEEVVYAELVEQTDKYNLYTIPIFLNGEEKSLKAEYDYDTRKFTILGAYDGLDDETGLTGRDIKKLKDGDEIEFLFYVYGDDNNEEMLPLGSITWKSNTVMEDADLGDGKFIYQFKIKSVFGDEDYPDPIYMELKDGQITVSEQ